MFVVAAVALAGFLFSLTPLAAWLDNTLLDVEWHALHKFHPRAAPDDIIVVGIDPATVASIAEPPGLWHESLGRALARIAQAHPRAIGFGFPLPERSYDSIRAGLDRALFTGLAAAIEASPLVAVLSIDPRTRGARRIHTPFLAILGESRLGIDLLARDGDGVTRRFSLLVPTEDGGFPTLAGRMCRALSRECSDGLIHYALGPALKYVPMKNVLEMTDERLVERLFRDRIVMVGETQPFTDRVDVPVNLAGWEPGGRTSPAIVVHALSLRTALQGAAPEEASRPLVVLILSLAALLALMSDWRLAAATGILLAAGAFVAATLALRGGLYVPLGSILLTALLAFIVRLVIRRREARRMQLSNIQHAR
jgi:CHASE2 domain-containing sensor protein